MKKSDVHNVFSKAHSAILSSDQPSGASSLYSSQAPQYDFFSVCTAEEIKSAVSLAMQDRRYPFSQRIQRIFLKGDYAQDNAIPASCIEMSVIGNMSGISYVCSSFMTDMELLLNKRVRIDYYDSSRYVSHSSDVLIYDSSDFIEDDSPICFSYMSADRHHDWNMTSILDMSAIEEAVGAVMSGRSVHSRYRTVLLCGSYASHTAGPRDDIDILILRHDLMTLVSPSGMSDLTDEDDGPYSDGIRIALENLLRKKVDIVTETMYMSMPDGDDMLLDAVILYRSDIDVMKKRQSFHEDDMEKKMGNDILDIEDIRRAVMNILADENDTSMSGGPHGMISRVLLFGSYASGRATRESDINLMIEGTGYYVHDFRSSCFMMDRYVIDPLYCHRFVERLGARLGRDINAFTRENALYYENYGLVNEACDGIVLADMGNDDMYDLEDIDISYYRGHVGVEDTTAYDDRHVSDTDQIRHAAEEVMSCLGNRNRPFHERVRSIWLFGSYSRGDARGTSDINIMIECESEDISYEYDIVNLMEHVLHKRVSSFMEKEAISVDYSLILEARKGILIYQA